MIDRVAWLAIEVKYLEPAVAFYHGSLALPVAARSDGEVTLDAGGTELRLRAPGPVPRGGLHTHFAFSTTSDEYDGWRDRLASDHDLHEERFGDARSLYCYDPDGNCVEIGERASGGSGLTGIFEVVLEVEDLDTAEAFWGLLADSVADRGDERRRVRLDLDVVDIELWEPQLGLADARGGVHVDLGLVADEPDGVVTALEPMAQSSRDVPRGRRLRDLDGHYVTLLGDDGERE